MIQQVFFLKIGRFDRKGLIDKKLKELNKDGWKVTSLTYTDGEYIILAEKEQLPSVVVNNLSEEELEEAKRLILEEYQKPQEHRPIIVSGDVRMSRVGNTIEFSDVNSLRLFIKAIQDQGVDKQSEV